eukprot:TRINITY_DN10874_c0_g1_i3.p1 TRINITY_DN10874_c0_g1~~TRINITY_DN10874_c0_g1_i3.p1  ORF type:complete len:480 (+),score=88.31 TRINITY_DN10874_c0_g1_i3:53-1492(+)
MMRSVRKAGINYLQSRTYSTAIPKAAPGLGEIPRKKVLIFNRKVKEIQRERFSKIPIEECKLHEHIAGIIMERLSYVQREFPTVMELGSARGILSKHYLRSNPPGLKRYIQCDSSQHMLDASFDETCKHVPNGCDLEQRLVDDEEHFPIKRKSVDLVIAMLNLHWVNDIEATLKEIRRVLKQDGVVFISVFGGKTLSELQSCFTVAENEREGGVSPHINPFMTGPSMGDLFTNAGFNFPTIDLDRFTFYWESAFHLMEYLQLIGENNCLIGRRPYTPRDTMVAMAAIYDHLWREEKGVPSTFEIIHGVGWSPHPSHAQPSLRGSGGLSLKDIAEGLGEQIHNEESSGSPHPDQASKDIRREQLQEVLQQKGIDPDKLNEMQKLMEKRIAGDDSSETAEAIIAIKRRIQGTYASSDDNIDYLRANLPSKDNTKPKISIVETQRGATILQMEDHLNDRLNPMTTLINKNPINSPQSEPEDK